MPNELPHTGFVRIEQIIGDKKANPPIIGLFPVGRTTWYGGIKAGKFPRPRKLAGGRASGWAVDDIRKLLADIGKAAA